MNTKCYNILLCTLSAAVLLVSACRRTNNATEESEARIDVAYPIIDSVMVYKTYPGSLTAHREVDLVARVNGYLVSKNYNSGDFVRKGTVLFTIEDRNYRDAVEKCRSALATAKANLEYASKRYEAMTEALKGDAVSRIEVDQAKSNLDDSRANVASAEAALRTAETQLSYCTVRAPFDGHVTVAVYDVGAYLGGEASPVTLASIYEDNTMIANFSIDDDKALAELQKNISDGTIDYRHIPVTFSDSLSRPYTAELDYLSPKVDTSTGTLSLQATLENPDNELRSGMFVSVALPVENLPQALLVKDASISTDQLGKYLYTVNDSDIVVYTPIQTGDLYQDSLRIVESGIDKSKRYVTKALLKVRRGMKVDPVLVK